MNNLSHDDIPRYKKKAKNRPPKKAKHKHEFMPCVLEFDEDAVYEERRIDDEKS